MSNKLVVCALILFVLVPVYAADAVDLQVAEANRYLAAETAKQIKTATTEMETSLKAYQDENFMLLDQRMDKTMREAQQRLILGVAGAVLLGGALMGYFMFHLARRYSYERYLEEELEKRDAMQPQGFQQPEANMQQAQQPTWQPQQPFQSIGMEVGQASAANMSQFNNWQVQSTRPGGWEYVPQEWKR